MKDSQRVQKLHIICTPEAKQQPNRSQNSFIKMGLCQNDSFGAVLCVLKYLDVTFTYVTQRPF